MNNRLVCLYHDYSTRNVVDRFFTDDGNNRIIQKVKERNEIGGDEIVNAIWIDGELINIGEDSQFGSVVESVKVICGKCGREETFSESVLFRISASAVSFMQKLEKDGWKFIRDENYVLVQVLCDRCEDDRTV